MKLTRKEKMLAIAKNALHRLARCECGTISSAQLAQGALSEIACIKAAMREQGRKA
jgi:hypothetical protein